MRAKRFEDLLVWQEARKLTLQIYRATRQTQLSNDAGLCHQIQGSAVSVMSNIAEGFERHSQAEFKHYLSVARGCAAEVRSQLYIAHDVGYITPAEFQDLVEKCHEISVMLNEFRASLG